MSLIYERKQPHSYGFSGISDVNLRIDFTKIKDE